MDNIQMNPTLESRPVVSEKKSKKGLIIGISAAILAIIIAVSVYFIFFREPTADEFIKDVNWELTIDDVKELSFMDTAPHKDSNNRTEESGVITATVHGIDGITDEDVLVRISFNREKKTVKHYALYFDSDEIIFDNILNFYGGEKEFEKKPFLLGEEYYICYQGKTTITVEKGDGIALMLINEAIL